MPLSDPEPQLEKLEKQLRERLGRELTAREKFYVALSEACNPLSTEGLGELDVIGMEAEAREEQDRIKERVRPSAEKFNRQSKLKQ